jgi:hypothetical protein
MSDVAAIPRGAAERRTASSAATLIGLAALVFSALYPLSDVIEAIQGGFSTGQRLRRTQPRPGVEDDAARGDHGARRAGLRLRCHQGRSAAAPSHFEACVERGRAAAAGGRPSRGLRW